MTKVKIGKKGGAKRVAAKIAKLRNPFPVRKTHRPPPADIRPADRGIIESYVIRGVTYHITERALADDRDCSVYRVMKSVGATGWEFIAGRWETPGGARGGILMHLHRPSEGKGRL